MEDQKTFSERFSDFRKEVAEMDWTADGINTNQGWSFLSESKIKGQLAPALAKHGIGWSATYKDLKVLDPIGSMKQHYIVVVTVTIFDALATTDATYQFEAYGEGADSGDKAVSKTQTNALKNVIANNFLLSSYTVEAESVMEGKASARAEGGTEREAIKAEAKERIIQAQKQTAPASVPTTTKINQIQMNAMEKILNKVKLSEPSALEQFGGLTEIENAYKEAIESGNPQQAAAFIQKYKVI